MLLQVLEWTVDSSTFGSSGIADFQEVPLGGEFMQIIVEKSSGSSGVVLMQEGLDSTTGDGGNSASITGNFNANIGILPQAISSVVIGPFASIAPRFASIEGTIRVRAIVEGHW